MSLKDYLGIVPNFPKEGINFFDITSLLSNSKARDELISELRKKLYAYPETDKELNKVAVVGIESRGFIFATELSDLLGVSLLLARKKGKLPNPQKVYSTYKLEYGEATLEMNMKDAKEYETYIIVDDIIATGGTMKAVENMIRYENPNAIIIFLAPFKIKGLLNTELKNLEYLEEIEE